MADAQAENLFLVVKQAIDELDRLGLLDMGTPRDEYDGESRSIADRIRADMSIPRIAGIMADEFSFCFAEHYGAERFMVAAQQVKAALEHEDMPWQWCLAGNIVESHEYGEEHEVRVGTKQFGPGAKVYIAPAQWGDGYENVCVIGKPRGKRSLIEVVMKMDLIENFRLKKVFQPAVLKRMEKSPHSWWGSTDESREQILELIESLKRNRENDWRTKNARKPI